MNPLEIWIDQTSTRTARAYSTWTTKDDVAQELWLWASKYEEKLSEYIMHPDAARIIQKILNQEARNYAIKERAVKTGYDAEDLTWYSAEQVRKILPDVFEYDNWQSFQSSAGDGRGATPIANATGDRLAYILDIKGALEKLKETDYVLLREHYGRGVSIQGCAIGLGISDAACTKRIQRAVYAISERINGVREYDPYEAVNGQFDTRTKGRHAMSNAAARAATDSNWSE